MALGATFAVTLVALALVYLSARRAITLCVLKIDSQRLYIMRGALPPSVLGDVRDVVRRARLVSGTVRIQRDGDRARVVVSSDVPSAAAQSLRNVIGIVPLAALISGSRRGIR